MKRQYPTSGWGSRHCSRMPIVLRLNHLAKSVEPTRTLVASVPSAGATVTDFAVAGNGFFAMPTEDMRKKYLPWECAPMSGHASHMAA